MAKNQTVPNQDQMELKELELFFDVDLKDGAQQDMQTPLFMTQIQQYLLPSFAGCPSMNIRFNANFAKILVH